jgi:hypothetical protein
MQETKEKTCAERISDALANTEASLRDIFTLIDDGRNEETEQGYESLNEYALGIDTRQETIITLSWGGPADYLEVTHRGAEIYSITYRFSDWFDTATVEVTDEESAIWRYAQDVINLQEGNY